VTQAVLFLGIGILILYFTYVNINNSYLEECATRGISESECKLKDRILFDFESTNGFWLIMMIIGFLLSNISRAIRWKMLLKVFGYKPKIWNLVSIIFLGYFTNLGFPRLGEFVRASALSKYEGIEIQKVLGTVIADRILDVLVLIILVIIGVLIEFDFLFEWIIENILHQFSYYKMLLHFFWSILVLICAGYILFIVYKKFQHVPLILKIRDFSDGVWKGILTINKTDSPFLLFFHSVIIWGLYLSVFYFSFLSFPPTSELPLTSALIVFVFGALGVLVPSPGGMGTFHFMVVLALVHFGIGKIDAFSFANINFFTNNIFSPVFYGIIALVLLPINNKRGNSIDKIKAL
jgi:uncharacterized protein (TIRG00374 family)